MKKIAILVSLICVFALSAVLSSCACSSSAASAAGTYSIYEIKGEGGSSPEEIASLHMDGLFINLNEDGTFDFVFVGLDNKGKWSAGSGKSLNLTPEDAGISMTDCTLDDDMLTLNLYGSETVFKKGAPKKVEDFV